MRKTENKITACFQMILTIFLWVFMITALEKASCWKMTQPTIYTQITVALIMLFPKSTSCDGCRRKWKSRKNNQIISIRPSVRRSSLPMARQLTGRRGTEIDRCSGFQANVWPLTAERAHSCEVGCLFDYILHVGPREQQLDVSHQKHYAAA